MSRCSVLGVSRLFGRVVRYRPGFGEPGGSSCRAVRRRRLGQRGGCRAVPGGGSRCPSCQGASVKGIVAGWGCSGWGNGASGQGVRRRRHTWRAVWNFNIRPLYVRESVPDLISCPFNIRPYVEMKCPRLIRTSIHPERDRISTALGMTVVRFCFCLCL